MSVTQTLPKEDRRDEDMQEEMQDEDMHYVISPDIHLREIDSDHLENIEGSRESVEFTVRLSSKPTEAWVQEFDQAYLQIPYTLKPPVRVYEDSLRIIYLPRYANELQSFFRFFDFNCRPLEQRNTSHGRDAHLQCPGAAEGRFSRSAAPDRIAEGVIRGREGFR